jgi:hypothetical protein
MTQSLEDSLRGKDKPGDEALEAALKAALYRQDCPYTMDLVEYQMGSLADPERERLQAHLTRCPHCKEELHRMAKSLYADMPVPKSAQDRDPGWIEELGFVWRRVRETVELIVRPLVETLTPPPPLLAPIPAKGRVEAEPADVVRRIILGPDQADDLDLEATIRRSSDDPRLCTLTVQVAVPSRWPDMAGTQVRATAGDWGAKGVTDEEGKVTLAGLPVNLVNGLVVEVNP